jgi:IS605 OrfB family transposase
VSEQVLTYNTEIIAKSDQDVKDLIKILEMERDGFNIASKIQFSLGKRSIKDLHRLGYNQIRKETSCPAQVAVRAYKSCLSAYRSIHSNKHDIKEPIVKKKLSISLDKRLYRRKGNSFFITTVSGRKEFSLNLYDRISKYLDKYPIGDPKVFERDGKLFISIPFKIPVEDIKPKKVLGVDLGMRINAACSDGRLINNKKFNGLRRKIRFNKRKLQSKKTKSSRRKLRKIKNRERNLSKNHTNHLANKILETDANIIALEDLKGIKEKKHKYQNKRAISQVPFYQLTQTLTYKALLLGKQVTLVCPRYTSQTDSVTGKREGERKGRRFYSKSGLVYDADINASINIAKKTKLPISQGNLLDGQGLVSDPYVLPRHYKPRLLRRGN